MDLELAGQRALITGGSKGVGLATACAFAREGCNVTIAARDPRQLEQAASELRKSYQVKVDTIAVDLSGKVGRESLVDAVGDQLDILVNNAGSIPGGDLWRIDELTWRGAWDLKVYAYIDLCRLLLPGMFQRRSGVVVNVIGGAAIRHRPNYVAGAAGNTALLAFTEAVGSDSLRRGVRMVAVNPGLVATERMESLLRVQADERWGEEERWRELIPDDPPPAKPAQIADAVVFLASERASHVSGVALTVDAGRHLR